MEDKLSLIKKDLIDGMLDYISDVDEQPPYSTVDVHIIDKLIDSFVSNLQQLQNPTEELVLEKVKQFVLTLNNLNTLSDGNLIETEQRELLCELIFMAAKNTGIQVPDTDFTEQWRDW